MLHFVFVRRRVQGLIENQVQLRNDSARVRTGTNDLIKVTVS